MTPEKLKGYVDTMVDAMLSRASDEDYIVSEEDQIDIMWGVIRRLSKKENSVYLALKDYDAMLSPLAREIADLTIPQWAWEKIVARAQQILDYSKDTDYKIAPIVRNHLESIILGKVPYGYTVIPEE